MCQKGVNIFSRSINYCRPPQSCHCMGNTAIGQWFSGWCTISCLHKSHQFLKTLALGHTQRAIFVIDNLFGFLLAHLSSHILNDIRRHTVLWYVGKNSVTVIALDVVPHCTTSSLLHLSLIAVSHTRCWKMLLFS